MKVQNILLSAGLTSIAHAWLPADKGLFSEPIRGVNLGSLFIAEPWMMHVSWKNMGCEGTESEFDCVKKLGQNAADAAFQRHWNSWITSEDFDRMKEWGINTVRIPIGYWMKEDLKYNDSEYFPRGGFNKLKEICRIAASKKIYVILDLHGAPGAQVARNSFTGQFAPSAGFFEWWQFERATKFLSWLTNEVYNDRTSFATTGTIQVVNEPEGGHANLQNDFYPKAYDAIRSVEDGRGISGPDELHIQFMASSWGSGDARNSLKNNWHAFYDNHRYLKWDTSVPADQGAYISTSCRDNVAWDGSWPLIVGEWSLGTRDDVWNPQESGNKDFYKRWFAAQVQAYERVQGWVFWGWKTELSVNVNGQWLPDYRWGYRQGVEAGVIPNSVNTAKNMKVC